MKLIRFIAAATLAALAVWATVRFAVWFLPLVWYCVTSVASALYWFNVRLLPLSGVPVYDGREINGGYFLAGLMALVEVMLFLGLAARLHNVEGRQIAERVEGAWAEQRERRQQGTEVSPPEER